MPSSGRDLVSKLTDVVRLHERERKTVSLPRYAPVSEIGRGGMGVVMKAWDRVLSRYVALKYVSVPEDPDALARFESEARLAASLNHANITAIHDFGDAATDEEKSKGRVKPFLVMALIEGRTLETEDCDAIQAARLVAQAARGVHHAHTKGVIHRDLKPGNIMVDAAGRAFVMDFGLAKAASREVPISAQGYVMGTPAYMSPEQAAGRTEEVDAKSDIYSLGATLYKLVTGRPPATGATSVEVVASVAHGSPPPVRSLRPACPKPIERAIEKAMAKRREERYETAEQFAIDLERAARPKRRKWAVIYSLSGAVGALAIVAIAAWAIVALTDPTERNERRMVELDIEAGRSDSIPRLKEILEEMRRLAPADRRTGLTKVRLQRREFEKAMEAQQEKCFQLFSERDIGGLRVSVAELPRADAIRGLVGWLEQFEAALAVADETWNREVPTELHERWHQAAAAHREVLAAAVRKKKEEAERTAQREAESRRRYQQEVDGADLPKLEELERRAAESWQRDAIRARRMTLADEAIPRLGGEGAEAAYRELSQIKGLDGARRLRIANAMLDRASLVWLKRTEEFEEPDAAFFERRGSLRLRITQSEAGVFEDWRKAEAAVQPTQRLLRARLRRRLGGAQEALDLLASMTGPEARFEAGMARLAQSDFRGAAVEFAGAGPEARYWHGVALKFAGKPQEALVELEAAKGGDSLTAMLAAARMSLKEPPVRQVIADLDRLLKDGVRLTEEEFVAIGEPTMDGARRYVRHELLLLRAKAYRHAKEPKQGEEDCNVVLEVDKKDFNALVERAYCRLAQGKRDSADADARKAEAGAVTVEQQETLKKLRIAIEKGRDD
jgi:hypothetical protein